MKELLRRLIPFELKRGTSLISIIVTLIITGILTKLGETILTFILDVLSGYLPLISQRLLSILLFKFEVNVLSILLGFLIFLLVLFPVYRYIDRILLNRKKKELIFEDNFLNGAGWHMNYWGTSNPQKTNRIEESRMIFEATPTEVSQKNGFFGAFYDLKNGIYQGNTYRVVCFVKSSSNASMGFQLWLHDTNGNPHDTDGKALLIEPKLSNTPPERGKEIEIKFTPTNTNAVRIHLHCKGGSGKIIVEYVRIYKI